MSKHTATLILDRSNRPWIIKDSDGYHVAEMTMPSMDEWALRIVRAVNCHEELVEALGSLEREISSRFGSEMDMSKDLRAVVMPARAALAKARGDA